MIRQYSHPQTSHLANIPCSYQVCLLSVERGGAQVFLTQPFSTTRKTRLDIILQTLARKTIDIKRFFCIDNLKMMSFKKSRHQVIEKSDNLILKKVKLDLPLSFHALAEIFTSFPLNKFCPPACYTNMRTKLDYFLSDFISPSLHIPQLSRLSLLSDPFSSKNLNLLLTIINNSYELQFFQLWVDLLSYISIVSFFLISVLFSKFNLCSFPQIESLKLTESVFCLCQIGVCSLLTLLYNITYMYILCPCVYMYV